MATISQREILIRTFKSNKTSVVGLFMALCVVAIALISPWISPYDPISQDMNVSMPLPAGHTLLAQIVMVGISSRGSSGDRESLWWWDPICSLGHGCRHSPCMIGGYKGGRIDNLVLRFIDIFMSFPL